MTSRLPLLPLSLCALLAIAPASASAATPAQKCASTKQKTAGKKAYGKLKCWSKGVKLGGNADTFCLGKAETNFGKKWDKAEAKGGCVPGNDKVSMEAKVDAFVDDVVDELTGSPAGALLDNQAKRDCASSKLRAAGKKAASKLKCHAKATSKGTTADTGCLGKAELKYNSRWDKAEARGGCATMNDKATIEGKVNAFVLDVVAELPSSGVTTTTATTSTTTTTLACGNGMIDPGEECDGADVGGVLCAGSAGGAFVDCNPNCTLDCSMCPGGQCAVTCKAIVPSQPIANTYQLLGVSGPKLCQTNSTNAFQPCNADGDCGVGTGLCIQTPWITADGFAFQFPTGIKTIFTVAAADPAPTCSHAACVSCGNPGAACAGIPGCGAPPDPPGNGCSKNTCCDTPGFTVPTFNVPILGGLCGRVDQAACGLGVVNTSQPQTGDNEVTKTGDTSDPGPDCLYGTGDDPLPQACTVIGAGADTKGKIVKTIGNGNPDATGIQFRIPTPMLATVWQDTANPCPDGSTFDPGEGIISQLVLSADPTSAGATGSFTDMPENMDGCARAGQGFSNSNQNGPITVGPPVARPQSYDGTLGAIQVAAGPVLSGSAPLNDIGFIGILPSSPATVLPAQACSCVPVAGCPE